MFRKKYKESGFTLIELMTTVVIIGIVAAMVSPTFDAAIKRNRFKAETKQIVSTLRTARSSAISEKMPMGVTYDADEKKIILFKEMSSPSNNKFDDGVDTIRAEVPFDTSYAYLASTFINEALIYLPNGSASESGRIDYSFYNSDVYCHSSVSVLASTGRAKVDYMQTDY